MSEAMDNIKKWAEEMSEYEPVSWDKLPQIYLYMDQVITYMESNLKPFNAEESSKLLTSSMINNYVKDGVLPRPEQKKYSSDHLAMLTVVCMLKPVLSIQNVSYLLNEQMHHNKSRLYNMFCTTQELALKEVCKRVQKVPNNRTNIMLRLAVELTMEANARRMAAEKIVNELMKESTDGAMENIKKWAEEMSEYEPVPWDKLPQIYLYMDQVITYMESNLKPFNAEESSKLLTSSMINNYVKDGVLPRPEQKKYSSNHLAMLTVICMLKPVLSIQNVSYLLNEQMHHNKGRLYNMFCTTQELALKEVCKRVQKVPNNRTNIMLRLAVELTMEANARRMAAEKIVNELMKESHVDENTAKEAAE